MAAPTSHVNHPNRLQTRTATPMGSRGSLTQTIASTNHPTDRTPSPSIPADPLVLRLRGAHQTSSSLTTLQDTNSETRTDEPRSRRRRIQWDENVIDNEGLGRKKSKVCCIYHKPRAVGESSDESSSSDSSSDSDSDSDSGFPGDGARPIKGTRRGRGRGGDKKTHNHNHNHDADADCAHDASRSSRRRHGARSERRPSPNAYEKMPKYDVKPLARQPGTV